MQGNGIQGKKPSSAFLGKGTLAACFQDTLEAPARKLLAPETLVSLGSLCRTMGQIGGKTWFTLATPAY